MAETTALDRFRSLVLRDEPLQLALSAIEIPARFAETALEAAERNGIPLAPGDLASVLSPDPLGLSRFAPVAPSAQWPPRHWLPVELLPGSPEMRVSWAHFAGRQLAEPFYGESVLRIASRPINRLVRWETPASAFLTDEAAAESRAPSGFIFHMSRCGSTLVAQMLAALPGATVVSEAAPLDGAVQLGSVEWLRAMVAALGRRRSAEAGPYVVKCDSWHALELPLFRRAFPDVPWVFLYRDPVEILVSQIRMRGLQTLPEYIPPSLYGLSAENAGSVDYCARVLVRIAESAVEAAERGRGLFVDYAELPGAVASKILPHFGIAGGRAEAAAMSAAARNDTKRPGESFVADSAAKQQAATGEVRQAAERRLGDLHRDLKSLSLAARSAAML